MLRLLYPLPFRLEGTTASEQVRFIAIPTARAPRLLVDVRAPQLAWLATRQANSSRLGLRAARRVLGAAARTGLYNRLPGTCIGVHGPADAPSITDELGSVLGCDELRIAVSIGPARANRKPVLQVADARGRVLAYVKVGHNDLTRSLVRSEAESLQRLATRSWEVVRPPHVVTLAQWRHLTLLVLEPLALPRRLPRSRARGKLLSVVAEIAATDGDASCPWRAHPLHQRLRSRLSRSSALDPWLRQLDRLPPDVELRSGAWHGDLNPGNIVLAPGSCPVWDWERFEPAVPVGFDLLHHDLQHAITRRRRPPATAAAELLRSAPAALAGFGHDAEQADAVCRAYLITLADRYLADDQAAAGASLGRIDEWLLPALEGPRA